MKTHDGLGRVIDDKALYYIQDTRSVVGNCALFWAENSAGYVCCLSEAGKYTGAVVRQQLGRDTDVMWPVEFTDQMVKRHVRFDALRAARRFPVTG